MSALEGERWNDYPRNVGIPDEAGVAIDLVGSANFKAVEELGNRGVGTWGRRIFGSLIGAVNIADAVLHNDGKTARAETAGLLAGLASAEAAGSYAGSGWGPVALFDTLELVVQPLLFPFLLLR